MAVATVAGHTGLAFDTAPCWQLQLLEGVSTGCLGLEDALYGRAHRRLRLGECAVAREREAAAVRPDRARERRALNQPVEPDQWVHGSNGASVTA